MLHYAILLDGGFVRRKLGSTVKQAVAADIEQLVAQIKAHAALSGLRLHRIYYYDATPLSATARKPLGGGVVEFAKSAPATRSQALFDALKNLPNFALRLGELAFEGWSVSRKLLDKCKETTLTVSAESLRPQITQKGVDMRIGLDIAALTLKKQADVIVLVTGDSDFVPAMKFARREGAQLYLVPMSHGIKDSMREHADLILDVPTISPGPLQT